MVNQTLVAKLTYKNTPAAFCTDALIGGPFLSDQFTFWNQSNRKKWANFVKVDFFLMVLNFQ